jgi:hypothetical protein
VIGAGSRSGDQDGGRCNQEQGRHDGERWRSVSALLSLSSSASLHRLLVIFAGGKIKDGGDGARGGVKGVRWFIVVAVVKVVLEDAAAKKVVFALSETVVAWPCKQQ